LAANQAPLLDEGFARKHPCRLLVAEDNPINQKVVRSLLSRLGYSPVVVEDGLDVISALKGGRFDVVLMDVEMGELGGPEATRRIRDEFPVSEQPVIIALTAHAGSEKRAELLAAGMDEYLTKPLHFERLVALLARWRDLRPRG
jgi:CheY-like chemotaxis protein